MKSTSKGAYTSLKLENFSALKPNFQSTIFRIYKFYIRKERQIIWNKLGFRNCFVYNFLKVARVCLIQFK